MIIKKFGIILIFSCLVCLSIIATEPVGIIAYMKGNVSVTRNGEALDSLDIEIGTEIENFDTIKTGSNGTATIELDPAQGAGAELKIEANTVFSLEINKIKSKKTTTVSVIAGSIALKVQKLTSTSNLNVSTETATMGVKGTNFYVDIAPGGDLFVGCDEGKVECGLQSSQKRVYAEPGSIVEYEDGQELKNVPVAVTDLKTFKKNWMADKLEVFKTNPLKAIKQYAAKYNELITRFNDAYALLIKQNDVINKWLKEDDKGTIGGNMDIMKDKKKLLTPLFTIRKQLVIFEKIYYRLAELQDYYKQGYGKGNIKTGQTVDDFFNKFDREKSDLEKKMAKVKHVIKMFARRNNGGFPADEFNTDDEESLDSFLQDDEDF